ELALTLPRVRNCRIAVKEWKEEIRFLYRVEEGTADRSYGIQVARLAGIPRQVLERAREVPFNLERNELDREGMPRLAGEKARRLAEPAQIQLFAEGPDPLREALRGIEVETMSPLAALNLLAELKRKVEA